MNNALMEPFKAMSSICLYFKLPHLGKLPLILGLFLIQKIKNYKDSVYVKANEKTTTCSFAKRLYSFRYCSSKLISCLNVNLFQTVKVMFFVMSLKFFPHFNSCAIYYLLKAHRIWSCTVLSSLNCHLICWELKMFHTLQDGVCNISIALP